MAKQPGLDREVVELREVGLNVSLDAAFAKTRRRIAYERLILDLLEGDPTLFVRADEVEAAWAWIDSIHHGWAAADMKPVKYAAGNWGRSSAIDLIERDGESCLTDLNYSIAAVTGRIGKRSEQARTK